MKMRYSDSNDWSYRYDHPVMVELTLGQVKKALKRIPAYKMPAANESLRYWLNARGDFRYTYIRKKDGSTWLVITTSWVNRCFEIPSVTAKRFESLNELVNSW